MIRNTGLVLVSLLVVLGGLELGLRAIGPGRETIFAIDEELIFAPIANRTGRYVRFAENGGEAIFTSLNEHAMRGPPFDPEAFSGRRVVVYGDSFVMARYSPLERTFVAQLERGLRGRDRAPVAVLNRGVDGYGPDQNLVRLRRDLDKFRPDLVVFTLFADNDFGDLIRNKLFSVGSDGALRRRAFVIDDAVRRRYQRRARRDPPLALLRAVLNPLSVRRDLRILLERRFGLNGVFPDARIDTAYRTGADVDWIGSWLDRGRAEYRDSILDGDDVIRLDNIRSDHYDADMTLFPAAPSTRYKIALMDLVLAEVARTLGARGTPLVLVLVPSPIDVCEGYDWQVDPARHPAYDRRLLTGALERIATNHAIPVLNLFPHFDRSDCNDLYFHFGNNHWTERGQALAAGLLAQKIATEGLLD